MGNPRIVLVEDERIIALDIKRGLERANFDVAGPYDSAEELLEILPGLNANLVLMDIRLRGVVDGIEAAEIIDRLYGIPVVLLTALADEATIARSRTVKAFAYLIKPFDERELRATVEAGLALPPSVSGP